MYPHSSIAVCLLYDVKKKSFAKGPSNAAPGPAVAKVARQLVSSVIVGHDLSTSSSKLSTHFIGSKLPVASKFNGSHV